MKSEDRQRAIECYSRYGPIFGSGRAIGIHDICIRDNCNVWRCSIGNVGTFGYECHPQYKSSLFVNTAGPDEDNYFSVLDYEVYTH